MKFKHLLILLLPLISGQVLAQTSGTTTSTSSSTTSSSTSTYSLPKPKDFDRWSIGGTIGISYLSSDLLAGEENNGRYLNSATVKPSFGIQGAYQASHSVGIRGRVLMTEFAGTDDDYLDSITKNPIVPGSGNGNGKLYKEIYTSPLLEGTLEMTYTFGNISFLNRNKNFHFVASLGLGFFSFDAQVKEDTINGQVLRESGKTTELMIPLSLGFKYRVGKVDIGLALDYRKTFTDNVDATPKTFSAYDDYIMLNAGVNYTFGKKNKPMEWVNPMEVVYNDLADMKEKIDILSGDKDKDGVSDLFDKDNSTAEGAKVYGDGTSVDIDGDGVADNLDLDPYTVKGAKVNASGQESDTDADGVYDSRDLEPNTAQGSLVNFQGITIAKPGEFGKDGLSSSGANGKDGASYLPSIFFDLGSSVIKPNNQDRLLVIARLMKANPDLKIKVTGNTDKLGGTEENNRLGQRRADAVKNQLIKVYGIDGSRISTETKGKSDPAATGLNAMNRRVDFSVE